MTERKHFILEVGTGSRSILTTGERVIKADEHYIGSDLNPKTDFYIPRILLRTDAHEHKGAMDFINADGRSLPFQDESVSEIILRNVLDLQPLDIPESRENTIDNKEDQEKTIKEVLRVLEKGGKLTVIETYTPGRAPFGEIKELLEALEFTWADQNELMIYDTRTLFQYAFGQNDVNYTKYQDVDWKKHPPYVATFTKI